MNHFWWLPQVLHRMLFLEYSLKTIAYDNDFQEVLLIHFSP